MKQAIIIFTLLLLSYLAGYYQAKKLLAQSLKTTGHITIDGQKIWCDTFDWRKFNGKGN